MSPDQKSPLVVLLFLCSSIATVIIHIRFLPEYFPDDLFRTSLTLQAGGFTLLVTFYSLGRLLSDAGQLPNMRTRDIGAAIFFVSLLLSLFLDSWGFTLQDVPEVHFLLGIGVYTGLALIGWAIGQRTAAINQIVAQEEGM